MNQVIGIVPAAGRASRLQPLTGSKEMLRVGNEHVIDYVLERMRRAGAAEIRVVTRPEKLDLIDHCRRVGTVVVEGTPRRVSESVDMGAEGVPPGTCVLIGFPDTLWDPVDGFVRLVERLAGGGSVVLGLFDAGPDAARSDVVDIDDAGRVLRITSKPPEPQSNVIWGCAAVRRSALDGVGRSLELGEHLMQLGEPLQGVFLSDRWIDIGTDEALRRVRHLAWIRAIG